jgi:hypothetical protein
MANGRIEGGPWPLNERPQRFTVCRVHGKEHRSTEPCPSCAAERKRRLTIGRQCLCGHYFFITVRGDRKLVACPKCKRILKGLP